MSQYTYPEVLVCSSVDSTALTNSTTATTILPPAAVFTLPANVLRVGQKIRITAQGRISTVVTSPGTLTLDVRFGNTVVANGGAMTLNTVAKTNVPWVLELDLTVRAIGNGTNANLIFQGVWVSEAVVASALPTAGGAGTAMLPNAAPAVGTGFDSTAAQAVNLFGTWQTASASNSILTHQYELMMVN